ncbi:MAG: transcriptional repressor [Deltaproteobacteria bacterium CG_4_10_14_3_um_filter_60_8]|nr:MAG: transcriptional repressor [Deltaproteobacteria bacterium CG_4_10_14_3_um_filter_60_8]
MKTGEKRAMQMLEKLRESGCRMTPQRLAVIRILGSSTRHPSVEQIFEEMQDDFPATSLATVYKTVTLLKELGEVLELGFGTGGNHYDGRLPVSHPHLVCTKCAKIEDADLGSMEQLARELAARSGYRITNHRLDFFGLCSRCQPQT